MKPFAFLSVIWLLLIGCARIGPQQDDFVSLHSVISQALGVGSDCGAIQTSSVGRYFEVNARSGGLIITVSERQFFTQSEWHRRYAYATNQISEWMQFAKTNSVADLNKFDPKTAAWLPGFTNAFGLFDLPTFSYRHIGVDVSIQEIDVVYEGYQKHFVEAQERYARIVKLLKPYDGANKRLETNRHRALPFEAERTFESGFCALSFAAAVAHSFR